jgi:hypothetical protein
VDLCRHLHNRVSDTRTKINEDRTNPTRIVEPAIRGAAQHVLLIISDVWGRKSPLLSSTGCVTAGFGSSVSHLSGHVLDWSEGHQEYWGVCTGEALTFIALDWSVRRRILWYFEHHGHCWTDPVGIAGCWSSSSSSNPLIRGSD